ncbi:TrkH family potassium uptake protein [Teredinibacter sp. KSP-S5-2]|uniref:TrkH family potassium uptake protein n=1 Tax=Teredinibacter sp. KSP-S5-2 TaxID=3034506 RepID=UPI00293493D8|nr:TrkH family potassium uptake protein [Teredinibacter sp. KSP-S5-2]WNO09160.1 TrkH family potassium uptake protein [Teredinibacter sp. KSP-S5-2]
MHFAVIFKVLGILLTLFSLTLAPPILVSLWYDDGAVDSFVIAFAITFVTGMLAWLPVYKIKQELRTRDGFLVTSLFWTVLALFGSLPLLLAEATQLSVVDAMFESLSGLTTTGATVLTGLDYLPRSILFYRQQLQWLGGIGIIVIAVAVLPMLGIGGMQLYRAETPGPVKDSKLTPRITETAKALFFIYLSLTIACAFGYWLTGMTPFDAITHSFSTVAIGGFSTHDASMGFFNDSRTYLVCMFFMVLSGVNFALHFFAWRDKGITHYLKDPEFKFYVSMIGIGLVICVGYLLTTNIYPVEEALIKGSFELISILTTTGFAVTDFSIWPSFLPFLIFMFAFMGGCAGSTGGGIKMIRVLLMIKQGMREIYRLIHPNAIIPIKIGTKSVSDRIVEAVWGFFAVYVVSYLTMCVVLLATGLDFVTAFTAIGACINNLGPGLGEVSTHYGNINSTAKWVLCFAMLLGRLEVFTLLVLFTPAFWRK